MSQLAFFAHANVFHLGGQPVPIELSTTSIPEDGKVKEVIGLTVDHSKLITASKESRANRYINERLSLNSHLPGSDTPRIPVFLRQEQVLSPGPSKQRPHHRQGIGPAKNV
ncbi:hypothetical protein TNCV_4396581 [Trichonephila clavipes]|uniref:Uncharacterized protein n=1 Tax=Trichonephila clavipes TaxID=2585209 RepID=A0A8X6W5N8_TRICX|nr:hypothetical protein TNCV_4396581 [Trichonephila clavipes]